MYLNGFQITKRRQALKNVIFINRPTNIKIGEHTISNRYCEKLLGVKIDSQLNFNKYLKKIIEKASQKVHVMARITPSMCISNKKVINEPFFQGLVFLLFTCIDVP